MNSTDHNQSLSINFLNSWQIIDGAKKDNTIDCKLQSLLKSNRTFEDNKVIKDNTTITWIAFMLMLIVT